MLFEYVPEIRKSDKIEICSEIKNFITNYSTEQFNIRMKTDFQIRFSFFNYTAKPISVKTRDGMCVEVQANPQADNPYFIIRKELIINKRSLDSAIKYITNISKKQQDTDIERIRSVLVTYSEKGYLEEALITIDYKFSYESINNSFNGIYHILTDIVLSNKEVTKVPEHPYSPFFINVKNFGKINNFSNFDKHESHFKIRYVSNSKKKLYFYCLGELHELVSEVCSIEKDLLIKNIKTNLLEVVNSNEYIEVFSTYSSNSNNMGEGVCVRKFSLEEAEELLGIYPDIIKATERGDYKNYKEQIINRLKTEYNLEKSKLDKEILESKKQLNLTEIELQKNRQQLEMEKLNLDRQKIDQENIAKQLYLKEEEIKNKRKDLELDFDKFKMTLELENLKRKANHEELKMEKENTITNKKNVMEIIKMIPVVLGSIITIVTIFNKLKKD